jgi:hypothetical protein
MIYKNQPHNQHIWKPVSDKSGCARVFRWSVSQYYVAAYGSSVRFWVRYTGVPLRFTPAYDIAPQGALC